MVEPVRLTVGASSTFRVVLQKKPPALYTSASPLGVVGVRAGASLKVSNFRWALMEGARLQIFCPQAKFSQGEVLGKCYYIRKLLHMRSIAIP